MSRSNSKSKTDVAGDILDVLKSPDISPFQAAVTALRWLRDSGLPGTTDLNTKAYDACFAIAQDAFSTVDPSRLANLQTDIASKWPRYSSGRACNESAVLLASFALQPTTDGTVKDAMELAVTLMFGAYTHVVLREPLQMSLMNTDPDKARYYNSPLRNSIVNEILRARGDATSEGAMFTRHGDLFVMFDTLIGGCGRPRASPSSEIGDTADRKRASRQSSKHNIGMVIPSRVATQRALKLSAESLLIRPSVVLFVTEAMKTNEMRSAAMDFAKVMDSGSTQRVHPYVYSKTNLSVQWHSTYVFNFGNVLRSKVKYDFVTGRVDLKADALEARLQEALESIIASLHRTLNITPGSPPTVKEELVPEDAFSSDEAIDILRVIRESNLTMYRTHEELQRDNVGRFNGNVEVPKTLRYFPVLQADLTDESLSRLNMLNGTSDAITVIKKLEASVTNDTNLLRIYMDSCAIKYNDPRSGISYQGEYWHPFLVRYTMRMLDALQYELTASILKCERLSVRVPSEKTPGKHRVVFVKSIDKFIEHHEKQHTNPDVSLTYIIRMALIQKLPIKTVLYAFYSKKETVAKHDWEVAFNGHYKRAVVAESAVSGKEDEGDLLILERRHFKTKEDLRDAFRTAHRDIIAHMMAHRNYIVRIRDMLSTFNGSSVSKLELSRRAKCRDVNEILSMIQMRSFENHPEAAAMRFLDRRSKQDVYHCFNEFLNTSMRGSRSIERMAGAFDRVRAAVVSGCCAVMATEDLYSRVSKMDGMGRVRLNMDLAMESRKKLTSVPVSTHPLFLSMCEELAAPSSKAAPLMDRVAESTGSKLTGSVLVDRALSVCHHSMVTACAMRTFMSYIAMFVARFVLDDALKAMTAYIRQHRQSVSGSKRGSVDEEDDRSSISLLNLDNECRRLVSHVQSALVLVIGQLRDVYHDADKRDHDSTSTGSKSPGKRELKVDVFQHVLSRLRKRITSGADVLPPTSTSGDYETITDTRFSDATQSYRHRPAVVADVNVSEKSEVHTPNSAPHKANPRRRETDAYTYAYAIQDVVITTTAEAFMRIARCESREHASDWLVSADTMKIVAAIMQELYDGIPVFVAEVRSVYALHIGKAQGSTERICKRLATSETPMENIVKNMEVIHTSVWGEKLRDAVEEFRKLNLPMTWRKLHDEDEKRRPFSNSGKRMSKVQEVAVPEWFNEMIYMCGKGPWMYEFLRPSNKFHVSQDSNDCLANNIQKLYSKRAAHLLSHVSM